MDANKNHVVTRNMESFEPCGPVREMIRNELRGKGRGAKTRLFEDCIVQTLKPKYPKLAERFRILREEAA